MHPEFEASSSTKTKLSALIHGVYFNRNIYIYMDPGDLNQHPFFTMKINSVSTKIT